MKKILIALFILLSVNSFAQLRNNNPRVFNVKTVGGAKGDGTTDDTRSIQSTINACYLAGGGQVFFPNGKYIIHDTLVTASSFVNGIRYGGSNSQLYIPNNQTPFIGHPLVNLELVGESAPNMFTSILVPYPINTSGVVLYSDITGSGTYPSLIGTAGDAWAYGNINDAQVSVKNINFRVKANIAASGPTMSAANFYKISSMGYFQNVLCDIDTASYYSVYPSALTFGVYFPYANNSAFNPIENCGVSGYKYGFIFSEHTAGNNLFAAACEYGYLFTGNPHSMQFGRLLSQWNKYTLANGSPNFTAYLQAVTINSLDVETDTSSAHWWQSKYILYDSTSGMRGDINYYIVQSPSGANASSTFNKLGGTNSLLQLRATGSYPDTVTNTTGFATIGRLRTDSAVLNALANSKIDSLRNNAGVLEGRKNGTFVPQFTLPLSGGGSGIFSRYGVAGTDSLKAYAPNYYRVGIYDTGYSRLSVTTNLLGATSPDTSGMMVINTTAATVGVQQYSPPMVWVGKGWKTAATASSQDVRYRAYVTPVQGTTNPTSFFIIDASINGGAYNSNPFKISEQGSVTMQIATINGGANFGSTITQNNGGAVSFSGITTVSQTALATTSTDAYVISNGTSATSGVPSQWSGRLRWTGRGWNNTISTINDWIAENQVTGGTNPVTTKWVLSSQINAAGYNARFGIGNLGNWDLSGVTGASGQVPVSTGTTMQWVSLADAVNTATDAAYTITSASQLVKLPVITANRVVTLPTGVAGQSLKIWNQNTSGTFSWSFSGTVKDAANNTITNLVNSTVYILEYDGSVWLKEN